ncbi:MAG: OstA-like protein, partial [Bacteroidota bacterium]
IKRLQGSVLFKHEETLMNCDSAYFNTVKNYIQAFSKIHLNQGDSIHLYGDSMVYDGNTRIAYVRKNVKLTHDEAVLTTDSLNYDRNTDIAYYFNYGKIVDKKNTLESNYGYYYSKIKDYIAVDSVVLINPDYIIYSDTLKYNINSETSWFYGPTEIISDSNYIYCENGWYNTNSDICQFNKNAYYTNKKQSLKGDSLYYDRKNGIGKAFINIEMVDSAENVLLTGNYAIYYEHPESSMATDSAVFIQVTDGDSLFLHGDTLFYITVTDTIIKRKNICFNDTAYLSMNVKVIDTLLVKKDSIYCRIETIIVDSTFVTDTIIYYPKDSLVIEYDTIKDFKLLLAYYRVRSYKSDLQSKCDSLVYSFRDSVIEMYYEPVIWSEKNQLTATYIELHTKNEKPDYIVLQDAAFIISREDSLRFNQIKGRDMIGYFRNDSLFRVNVDGNGQSVYFVKEEDKNDSIEKLIGVNKAEGSRLVIYLEDNEPQKIMFFTKPEGVMNPVEYLPLGDLRLKDFIWLEDIKPLNRYDIFIWYGLSKAVKQIQIIDEEGVDDDADESEVPIEIPE